MAGLPRPREVLDDVLAWERGGLLFGDRVDAWLARGSRRDVPVPVQAILVHGHGLGHGL